MVMTEKYAKHLTFDHKDLPGTYPVPIDVTLVRLYYIVGEPEIKQENVFFHSRIGCCIKSDKKSDYRYTNNVELYTQYIGKVQTSTVYSDKGKSDDKCVYEIYCFDDKVEEGYEKLNKYLIKILKKFNEEMMEISKQFEILDNVINKNKGYETAN
jgi:hypothetical protein